MATGFIGVRKLENSGFVNFSRCVSLALALAATPAAAVDVALAGLLPNRAVLVINGGAPRTLGVGSSSPEGVKVVAIEGDAATLEIDGKRKRLVLGAQAASSSRPDSGGNGGAQIIHLTANSRGQVFTTGTVNGASIRFLVDTGATYVALGAADAKRANIDYLKGVPHVTNTANGQVRAWGIKLKNVRIGDITLHEVDGSILEHDMPVALLGMSFLNRMEIRQDGSAMTLKKRY
jgi:aspartyl protease family protein